MRWQFFRWAGPALGTAFGLAVLSGPAAADPLPAAVDPLLRDWPPNGLAEVSVYDATIPRYDRPRPGTVTVIFVREPWDVARGVKSGGPGPGDFSVLKMNVIVSFPTGIYRYEQMGSFHWRPDTGRRVKFSVTHHEACGNTFKQLRFDGDRADVEIRSYWENEGDRDAERTVAAGAVFADEFPFRLRAAAAAGWSGQVTVPVYPTLIHGRADPLEPEEAVVRVAERTSERVVFEVRRAAGIDRLVFDAQSPWRLRQWDQADGTRWKLRRSIVTDYWNKTRPGDEKLLR